MNKLLLAVALMGAPKADLVEIKIPKQWFGKSFTSNGKPVEKFWCGRKMEKPLLTALWCVQYFERKYKVKMLHTFNGCYNPRQKRWGTGWRIVGMAGCCRRSQAFGSR